MKISKTNLLISCIVTIFGLGWPLYLIQLSRYLELKLEGESFASLAAKKQAVSDFKDGNITFHAYPGYDFLHYTNEFPSALIKTQSYTSSLSQVFVDEYNKRMKDLLLKKH